MSLTIRELWDWLTEDHTADALLDWAPDVAALTSVLLERSHAFRFVVSPPDGAGSSSPPQAASVRESATIHIVFIPVTGVSVNPARSLGPAVFVGGQALQQLWLFIIIPPIGGLIAGWCFRSGTLSAN